MILTIPKAEPRCLYCAGPVEKGGKGEHIVQEAIGGCRTLNDMSAVRVCMGCNTGVLSAVDKELCSRSFLSIVASQEIDAHLWQAWDLDHTSNNLLLEAKPKWHDNYVLQHLVCYPQITFERRVADFRGDAEEMGHFGRENFEAVLKKAACHAFQRYEQGRRGITFEQCRSGVIDAGYRLAPRLYARRTIQEIAKRSEKEIFYLRYVSDEDKNYALDTLSKLHRQGPSREFRQILGSHTPTISFFFDVGDTLRGLLKIGLNLVAALCETTPINVQTFSQPIRLIRGDLPVRAELIAIMGFVRPEGVIQSIAAPNKAHSFLITHAGGHWHVYSSFFGGRIGSYVNFPGPHNESWGTANVVAPLRSHDWKITKSRLVQLHKVKVESRDGSKIVPTMQLQRTVSELQVRLEKRKRKAKVS